jgi:hypothetical protein
MSQITENEMLQFIEGLLNVTVNREITNEERDDALSKAVNFVGIDSWIKLTEIMDNAHTRTLTALERKNVRNIICHKPENN